MTVDPNGESSGSLGFLGFRSLALLPRALKRAYQYDFLVKQLPRIAMDRNPEAVLKEQIHFYGTVSNKKLPWRCMASFGKPFTEGQLHVTGGGRDQYGAFLDWNARRGKSAHGEMLNRHGGNFCYSTNVRPRIDGTWEEYVDTVFVPYGIRVSAVANYFLPFRKNIRLGLYYAFDVSEKDIASRFAMDFISLPFAIVWLHRFGVVDEPTMRHWLFMLVDLTPAQLFVIREVVSARRYHNSIVTERTGLTKRNLERHFNDLSDILNERLPRDDEMLRNGSILADLANNYGFLNFTGRAAYQIIQPGQVDI